MKKNCLLFAFIFAIGLWSCERNEPEPVYERCMLTKSYGEGDTSRMSTTFFYDNNDRLVKMHTPSPPGPLRGSNYIYGSNTITDTDMVYPNSYTTYYLRADSLAYASVSYEQGRFYDTLSYFYNTEKYLIKAVRYDGLGRKDSSLLTYADNNLQRIDTYNSNGFAGYVSFSYGSIPSKAWYYQNNTWYLESKRYFPWFGKGNTKLASSYTFDFSGWSETLNIDYTLDASGYIRSMKQTNLRMSSSTVFFEHSCR